MLTYQKIKELCKDCGKTITGLESECGFARGSLCKVDKNKPSMDRVAKLAHALDVSVYELLDEDDNMDSSNGNLKISDEDAEMLQIMHDRKDIRTLCKITNECTPEDLELIIKMVQKLRKD